MTEISQVERRQDDLLAEVEYLRQEVSRLQQSNGDLEIALQTITQHGDTVEADLYQTNQRLQREIGERQRAQATLQSILETVSQDKADLEVMLKTTTEHGDVVEYELYTRAVETMRQSEELFRAISESTPILMILTQKLDGAIAYANSTSSLRLGVETQELVGRKIQDFFANPMDYQQMQSIVQEQGFVQNYEVQTRRTDGTVFWVSASVHPMVLGGAQTLLTTLFDISDRRQMEAALRASEEQLRKQAQELEYRVEQRTAELKQAEEKYRSIFENAAEGIFQIAPEGYYLSINPALAELYGYNSPEEMMAQVIDVDQQIYVRPRRWDELLAYMKRFDAIEGAESEVSRKDGSVIWISENVRVIKDESDNVLYYEGSVWNISDRKAAEDQLRQQRRRSELLLLNVLPQPIAERLKRGETNIADSFAEATVLFADLANFTELSASILPTELIQLLSEIFSAFDALADKHHLEKIKTIGDAYMVVGGLPTPTPDHVTSIANMSMDMHNAIAQFKANQGKQLALRVGIHTGPVIAGVIGNRRFTYDLWGDTVNIASRMEAQGEVRRTQVTEEVYKRLEKRYLLEKRGAIAIKGRGKMNTYWLLGQKGPTL